MAGYSWLKGGRSRYAHARDAPMIFADNRFFVTGGSLPSDNPSYVERQADRELYEALLQGEFCYVLHARQMGKSSLKVRTAARLNQAGVRVAAVELTALGQNLRAEQWYYSLLVRLGEQLGLDEELDRFWTQQPRLGPLRCFMAALEQVALAGVGGGMGEWESGRMGAPDGVPHSPIPPLSHSAFPPAPSAASSATGRWNVSGT